MLDAHSDREWLGFERHTRACELGEGVPSTVARREHRRLGVQALAAREHQLGEAPVGNLEALGALAEALDDARFAKPRPQVAEHVSQPIGADVRPSVGQDFGRCSELDETPQHPFQVGVAAARVELAVRERPSAALAELDVALGIEAAASEEACNVAGALLDGLTALDEQWHHARLQKGEHGEKTCRPGTDDHRLHLAAPPPHRERCRQRRRTRDAGASRTSEHRFLVVDHHVDGHDPDRWAPSRVERPPHQRHAAHGGERYTERPRRRRAPRLGVVARPTAEVTDADRHEGVAGT